MDIKTLFIVILVAIIFFLIKNRPQKLSKRITTSGTGNIKPRSISNVADQLYFVENGAFKKRKLMNQQEYYLFRKLETFLEKNYATFRVFPQVSMGEILSGDNTQAHSSINSKRVDFVIISKYGEPCVVIEYQGEGHYQANAASRDAVKKEACRKAGVRYVEIDAHYSDDDISLLGRHLTQTH